MNGRDKDLEDAQEKVRRARARLADTMGEVQNRLHPTNLINDALQEFRLRGQDLADHAVDLVRAKPVAATAAVAAAIALFAREPIWRALTTLIFHRRETPAADEGLKLVDDPIPPGSGELPHRSKEVA